MKQVKKLCKSIILAVSYNLAIAEKKLQNNSSFDKLWTHAPPILIGRYYQLNHEETRWVAKQM